MAVKISLNLADVSKKMGMVAEGLHKGLMTAVAEWLRFTIRQAFEAQASPEGVPWKPLSPDYALRKKAGLRILELTGALFQSVDRSVRISGNLVIAESARPYAAIHQYGGTIRVPEIFPKNARALFFSIGGKNVFARSARAHVVSMPARPFLPSPAFAEAQAGAVVEEALDGLIKQAGAGPAGSGRKAPG
jgi:phage virion morphogenesis protein